MATLGDIRKRLSLQNLKEAESLAVEDNVPLIKTLEIDQLKHGLRKDGTKIGRYKNEHYAVQKYIQNPLAGFGNMDWIKTGQLASEIFVDVREEVYVIDSSDIKTANLIEQHGDPFGLTIENKGKLISGGLKASFVQRMIQKLST